MAVVTEPIILDETGQDIVTQLQAIVAGLAPNAGQISYSNATSGLSADDVQEAIDEVESNVVTVSNSLAHLYGVGAIWMTLSNADPNNFLPGTWEKVEGKFLLGSSSNYTVGDTGGEETHLLTANESGIREHNHPIALRSGASTGSYYAAPPMSSQTGTSSTPTNVVQNVSSSNALNAHNNMPPYLVVNIWKRVS